MPPTTAVIANTQREALRLAPLGAIFIRPNSPVLGLRIDRLIVAANVEANLRWWGEDVRSRLEPNAVIEYADDHRAAGT